MGGGGGYVGRSPGTTQDISLSQKMWNDYKSRYLPIEQHMAKQASNPNYRRGIDVSAATSEAIQSADKTTRGLRRIAFSRGINPAGGKALMIDDPSATQAGATAAETGTNAGVTSKNIGFGLNAASRGNHTLNEAVNGIERSSQMQNTKRIAQQEYQNMQDAQVMNAVGAAVGTYAGLHRSKQSANDKRAIKFYDNQYLYGSEPWGQQGLGLQGSTSQGYGLQGFGGVN